MQCIYSSGTCERSATHPTRLERLEFPQADRLAGPPGLGQLQDHYHQNDNDQDTNNDPNDSSVHFSSFDSHAEVILGDKITSSAHAVRASTFLR